MGDPGEELIARINELKREGFSGTHAHGVASLESRVRQWPPEWGDELRIVLYGDFEPPAAPHCYPALGITVFSEKKKGTLVQGAMTVIEASVKVGEKSLAGLIDASKRINLLLGTYTLYEWGNGVCGWWSSVTHGGMAGVGTKFSHDGIDASAMAILNLRSDVRFKIEAALFWIREPRSLLQLSYRSDTLRCFSSYWNSFECLVEAVNLVAPKTGSSREEKQNQIETFFHERAGRLTPQNIQDCFRTIIDTGLRGKATHALKVCFPNEGERYATDCFGVPDKKERLYDIRNAINHGNIDAENPNEVARIEGRLNRLWMIVWRMFGKFIPFPVPIDSENS